MDIFIVPGTVTCMSERSAGKLSENYLRGGGRNVNNPDTDHQVNNRYNMIIGLSYQSHVVQLLKSLLY